MAYLDLNCMLGPTSTNRVPSFRTAEALLTEMDRMGIEEALVYASQAQMGHPVDGNARILEMIKGRPRLHACWAVLPPGTDEQPDPETLLQAMKKNSVRAARVFPEDHLYPLLERSFRPLFSILEREKIPLLIDTGRKSWKDINLDWNELFYIAEKYPSLPLVLMREGGATARVLFGVWNSFPNIYLETSYIQESRIVEHLIDRFGHKRLLFGTAMPLYDPGGPMALIKGAKISGEQRAAIGENNSRRLLNLPGRKPEQTNVWPVGPAGFRIFDIHGHLGRFYRKYHPDWTARDMIQRMDQVGIDKFAVSDVQAIGPDFRMGNSRVGNAIKDYPERLIGYVVFNPNYEKEMQAELERGFDELGCRGIKLHCTLHEAGIDDPRYRRAYKTAQERKCPLLCHVDQSASPRIIDRLLAEYPEMPFIYAHMGGKDFDSVTPYLDIANRRNNLFFDLGHSTIWRGVLAWLTDKIPVEQIVYGSDHPLNEFTYQMGRVLYAEFSDEKKQKIFYDNAAALFRI